MIPSDAALLIDENALAFARTCVRMRYDGRVMRGITIEDIEAAGIAGLWRAALEFDPARSVPFLRYAAWRIAEYARTFVMQWAYRSRGITLDLSGWQKSAPVSTENPYRAAAAKDEIRVHMAKLTKSARECVTDHFLCQIPIGAIADRRGVAINTVHSHLSQRLNR